MCFTFLTSLSWYLRSLLSSLYVCLWTTPSDETMMACSFTCIPRSCCSLLLSGSYFSFFSLLFLFMTISSPSFWSYGTVISIMWRPSSSIHEISGLSLIRSSGRESSKAFIVELTLGMTLSLAPIASTRTLETLLCLSVMSESAFPLQPFNLWQSVCSVPSRPHIGHGVFRLLNKAPTGRLFVLAWRAKRTILSLNVAWGCPMNQFEEGLSFIATKVWPFIGCDINLLNAASLFTSVRTFATSLAWNIGSNLWLTLSCMNACIFSSIFTFTCSSAADRNALTAVVFLPSLHNGPQSRKSESSFCSTFRDLASSCVSAVIISTVFAFLLLMSDMIALTFIIFFLSWLSKIPSPPSFHEVVKNSLGVPLAPMWELIITLIDRSSVERSLSLTSPFSKMKSIDGSTHLLTQSIFWFNLSAETPIFSTRLIAWLIVCDVVLSFAIFDTPSCVPRYVIVSWRLYVGTTSLHMYISDASNVLLLPSCTYPSFMHFDGLMLIFM